MIQWLRNKMKKWNDIWNFIIDNIKSEIEWLDIKMKIKQYFEIEWQLRMKVIENINKEKFLWNHIKLINDNKNIKFFIFTKFIEY